jgi:c-di-GMP-binding flagellar brake protein YcgR
MLAGEGDSFFGALMLDDEKRKFTRVPFETTVTVTVGSKVIVSRTLRNISLGGMYLYSGDDLPTGSVCVLDIELKGPVSLLLIQAEAEVVRIDPGEGVALKFTKIDVDGLIHLRHVIRIYAEDPAVVDLEFTGNLLGLDPAS